MALTNCHFSHLKAMISLSLMGGPNSLGGQSRERGGNLAPFDLIGRRFQIGLFYIDLSGPLILYLKSLLYRP